MQLLLLRAIGREHRSHDGRSNQRDVDRSLDRTSAISRSRASRWRGGRAPRCGGWANWRCAHRRLSDPARRRFRVFLCALVQVVSPCLTSRLSGTMPPRFAHRSERALPCHVLVQPEQIRRVVLPLHGDKSLILVSEHRADELAGIFRESGEVEGRLARRKPLQTVEDTSRPRDVLLDSCQTCIAPRPDCLTYFVSAIQISDVIESVAYTSLSRATVSPSG